MFLGATYRNIDNSKVAAHPSMEDLRKLHYSSGYSAYRHSECPAFDTAISLLSDKYKYINIIYCRFSSLNI